MGINKEPGWRASMGGERSHRHRAGRTRSNEKASADDVDHRSLTADRPVVRTNLAPLYEPPEPFACCVCSGVVQTHAPRHGTAGALSRAGSSCGRSHLAGPNSGGKPQTNRCAGYRRTEGKNSDIGSVDL